MFGIFSKISNKNNIGMLVVTHNMDLARKVCNRIIELPKINNKLGS